MNSIQVRTKRIVQSNSVATLLPRKMYPQERRTYFVGGKTCIDSDAQATRSRFTMGLANISTERSYVAGHGMYISSLQACEDDMSVCSCSSPRPVPYGDDEACAVCCSMLRSSFSSDVVEQWRKHPSPSLRPADVWPFFAIFASQSVGKAYLCCRTRPVHFRIFVRCKLEV